MAVVRVGLSSCWSERADHFPGWVSQGALCLSPRLLSTFLQRKILPAPAVRARRLPLPILGCGKICGSTTSWIEFLLDNILALRPGGPLHPCACHNLARLGKAPTFVFSLAKLRFTSPAGSLPEKVAKVTTLLSRHATADCWTPDISLARSSYIPLAPLTLSFGSVQPGSQFLHIVPRVDSFVPSLGTPVGE